MPPHSSSYPSPGRRRLFPLAGAGQDVWKRIPALSWRVSTVTLGSVNKETLIFIHVTFDLRTSKHFAEMPFTRDHPQQLWE